MIRALSIFIVLLSGCHTLGKHSGDDDISSGLPASLSTARLLTPSNDRDWTPDLAVLPYADIQGDEAIVHNIRSCVYESDSDYVVNHYDKRFDLSKIRNVDFIVVPFKDTPSLAHTMLSFGFSDGEHIVLSAEARLEKGEKYSPILGELRQYELMYVLADERDAILRRTKHRDADVYVYRTIASPEQSRDLFVDVLQRVNQLAEVPEFYDTLSNNCTTNIVRHLNRLKPGRVPYDVRALLPGFSDGLAYELGLLDTSLPFQEARRRARVTDIANRFADSADFSTEIRR
ncbi:MAG: DUF4105 domain-containing protein [Planctomycetaceae bacterium]|nr:DUF4105 domain-containing protein [Planctomycetales bacterium]MCB9922909.1 DUF4105 domain-containing protein [Planctomycetaceae bacterium]